MVISNWCTNRSAHTTFTDRKQAREVLGHRPEGYQEKRKKGIHYKIFSNPNISLLMTERSVSGYHYKGLSCSHSMKPSTEASQLKQIDELEEQKGRTAKI